MYRSYRWFFILVLISPVLYLLGTAHSPAAASSASLSLGETVIGEGDDFATRVLGMPWDMNVEPYPDLFTTLKNINVDQFEVTGDGFWDMHSENSDPRMWMLWTGVGTTQRVLRMGDTRPIDASKYKLLSYYMCLDQAPNPNPGQDDDWAANVYWMYDRTPHDDPANGHTEFILFKQHGRFKTPGSCELITFDLSQPSVWAESDWNNSPSMPMGLRLDPINQDNKTYRIGWVRLTTKDTSNVVPLNWSGAPAGTNKFYVSLTGCGQGGILIGEKAGTSGTFNWGAALLPGFSNAYPLPLPESFEPGSYFVYMKDANGGTACAGNNPLKISPAPLLEFQKPSFQSGPDFGTNVVGNAWGMANSQDIEEMVSVTTSKFENGVLTITAEDSDPRLFLNLNDHKIPAVQYRYASFRFRIVGVHEAGSGWIQRWVWWYGGGPGVDNVTTQDMQLYEDWYVYTIDLKTAPVENCSANCWSGLPHVLRFDPFETPKPTEIQMDYVLLTAEESVTKGTAFPIYFTTDAPPNAVVRFYYDTDKNPANGRTLIGSTTVGPVQEPMFIEFGNFAVYLPAIWRQDPSDIDLFSGSEKFIWNTAGVPKNTFFISAEVDDGVMVTVWYSEIPVTIK